MSNPTTTERRVPSCRVAWQVLGLLPLKTRPVNQAQIGEDLVQLIWRRFVREIVLRQVLAPPNRRCEPGGLIGDG